MDLTYGVTLTKCMQNNRIKRYGCGGMEVGVVGEEVTDLQTKERLEPRRVMNRLGGKQTLSTLHKCGPYVQNSAYKILTE